MESSPSRGNAGSAEDISNAQNNGAEFIGLFRSEFLFQQFDEEPDEDRQLAAYQEALAPSGESFPVTVRLLDVGGDKPLIFLPQPRGSQSLPWCSGNQTA